jgi:hypothetical protein
MVLSKKLQHKYESYSVWVDLNGYKHKIIVTIFNGTDFEFHRHNSQSQQSINYKDFEKIKEMIIDSFIVGEPEES